MCVAVDRWSKRATHRTIGLAGQRAAVELFIACGFGNGYAIFIELRRMFAPNDIMEDWKQ